jgi:GAG-polyprotein viral zinc-finger
MSKVYVLHLAQGKFYVGTSSDPEKRLEAHRNGTSTSAAWTRMYKPTGRIEIIESSGPFSEDNETLQHMSTYGIENVRGGSYAKPNLSEAEIQGIEERLRHMRHECLHCGGNDHFVKDCPNIGASRKRSHSGNDNFCKRGKTGPCYRCCRTGHFQDDCYAKTNVDGYALEQYEDDDSDEDDGSDDDEDDDSDESDGSDGDEDDDSDEDSYH